MQCYFCEENVHATREVNGKNACYNCYLEANESMDSIGDFPNLEEFEIELTGKDATIADLESLLVWAANKLEQKDKETIFNRLRKLTGYKTENDLIIHKVRWENEEKTIVTLLQSWDLTEQLENLDFKEKQHEQLGENEQFISQRGLDDMGIIATFI